MKICYTCKQKLPISCFYAQKVNKDGLNGSCKDCVKARATAWNKNNKVRRREISKESDARYALVKRQKSKIWRDSNKSSISLYMKARKRENRFQYNAYENKRRASKLNATPAWANYKYIEMFYKLAKEEEKDLGIKIHVDHIVPLKSKYVCGLHNEFNLQLLPAKENAKKLNLWWPDMMTGELK